MPGRTRIIPLGGLGEVGKNMTVIEADGEAVVIDAGLAFPRDEHLGVDLILPDFSYLVDRDRPVRAVLLTHGHEDHVGALPYLLRESRVQEVWATRLTLGLIKSKLDEHGLLRSVELREADPDDQPIELGPFRVGSSGSRTRFRTRSPSCSTRRAAGSCTPGTTSSTTRRWTVCAPTSAAWPRSATAASTSSSATRRTPNARA
jgi:hypothetical protein